jgi:regulator-associated protein of mTOR
VGHGHESYRVNTSASAPRQEFPASLRSTFYEYCKAKFNEPILEPVNDDEDPLSEKGVAKRERSRRYERIQLAARKLMLPSVAAATASTGNASGSMLPMEASPPYSSFNRSAPGASSVHSRYIPPSGSTPNTLGSFGQAERDEMKRYSLNLRQCAVLNNEAEMTSLLLFHPYESLLVVADEKDQISVWNFEQSDKILTFGNKNPMGSRLTSLTWINENEESLLTCGSDDGVIKLYHGLHTSHLSASSCPKLLTAFVAVPDLVPGTRGSGLVTNWQQEAGMLYAGGNSSMVRGWNLRQERCTFGVPTHTDSCITSMASDETKGGILVAGFGDGSIRLFDSRSRPEYALKATMKEHSSWVVQTHVFTGRNELLSGSVSGELKFWDLRYAKTSIRTLEAHRSPMTALAVHDYAPIFAR